MIMTYFKVKLTYNKGVSKLAKQIGKRLKEARENVQLTQEEVGAALGIGRAAYANIENGRSLLGVDHLLNLPSILRKPVTYFLGVNGELPQDEAEWLEIYRSLEPNQRKLIFGVVVSWRDGLRGRG